MSNTAHPALTTEDGTSLRMSASDEFILTELHMPDAAPRHRWISTLVKRVDPTVRFFGYGPTSNAASNDAYEALDEATGRADEHLAWLNDNHPND